MAAYKVLYFTAYYQHAGNVPPLILDRRVATALNWIWHTDYWPMTGWTTDQYAEYLDIAATWARQWKTDADVVERTLFAIGQSDELAIKAMLG